MPTTHSTTQPPPTPRSGRYSPGNRLSAMAGAYAEWTRANRRAAYAAANPPADPTPTEPLEDGCGTEAGYQAHRQRRDPRCLPCRAAHSAHNSARKTARRLEAGLS